MKGTQQNATGIFM